MPIISVFDIEKNKGDKRDRTYSGSSSDSNIVVLEKGSKNLLNDDSDDENDH